MYRSPQITFPGRSGIPGQKNTWNPFPLPAAPSAALLALRAAPWPQPPAVHAGPGPGSASGWLSSASPASPGLPSSGCPCLPKALWAAAWPCLWTPNQPRCQALEAFGQRHPPASPEPCASWSATGQLPGAARSLRPPAPASGPFAPIPIFTTPDQAPSSGFLPCLPN